MAQVLYVSSDITKLTVESNHLQIHKPAERLSHTVRLDELEQVIIAGATIIDARSLRRICNRGIPVLLLDSKHPTASTFCFADPGGNLPRRWLQHQWLTNEQAQLRFARALIGQKIRKQRHLLQYAITQRPDLRLPLTQGCRLLSERLDSLHQQTSINALRGIEGAASASFFAAYQKAFAPSLNFEQRRKHPALDPVNSALSLGYTLLLSECLRLILQAGLDPWLGVLHRPTYNRPSLACDFQELARAEIERWIWDLFRKQTLMAKHFTNTEAGCRLEKEGATLYYKSWAAIRPDISNQLQKAMTRYLALDIKNSFLAGE